MKGRAPWLLLLILAADVHAQDDTSVRVSIYGIFKPAEARISSNQPMQVIAVAEDGKTGKYASRSVQIICGGRWPIQMETGNKVVLTGSVQFKPAAGQTLTVGVKDGPQREYAGWIEIKEQQDPWQGRCLVINHVPLEAYVRDVACRELGVSAAEALKAQAVAVRSYALASTGNHLGDFDFCDLTHCQAYSGRGACTAEQHGHLDSVSGLALLYEGRPAMTYYHSTCGGHTASAEDVFRPQAARPYLKGVRDGDKPYCASSEHMRWRFEVDRKELCDHLAKGPCTVEVHSTGRGGWVHWVAVRGKECVMMRGESFHNQMGGKFGWGRFKSSSFRVETSGKRVVFYGRGLGHGVGMCQHGAKGMAKAGKDYRAILEHYYPGTELKQWP